MKRTEPPLTDSKIVYSIWLPCRIRSFSSCQIMVHGVWNRKSPCCEQRCCNAVTSIGRIRRMSMTYSSFWKLSSIEWIAAGGNTLQIWMKIPHCELLLVTLQKSEQTPHFLCLRLRVSEFLLKRLACSCMVPHTSKILGFFLTSTSFQIKYVAFWINASKLCRDPLVSSLYLAL